MGCYLLVHSLPEIPGSSQGGPSACGSDSMCQGKDISSLRSVFFQVLMSEESKGDFQRAFWGVWIRDDWVVQWAGHTYFY